MAEEKHAATLRTLSERRKDLVQERTRALNRLYRLLRDLLPRGAGVCSGDGSMHVKAVKLAGVHEVMGGQGHDSVSERCSDAPTACFTVVDLQGRIPHGESSLGCLRQ